MLKIFLQNVPLNEVLKHAITWMDLGNIVLNESSQSQKTTHSMTLFLWNILNRQIFRDRKQISAGIELKKTGGWGTEIGAWWLKSMGILGGRWWKCSRIDYRDGCKILSMLKAIELYTLNGWIGSGWCGSVDRALACASKGYQFDS